MFIESFHSNDYYELENPADIVKQMNGSERFGVTMFFGKTKIKDLSDHTLKMWENCYS